MSTRLSRASSAAALLGAACLTALPLSSSASAATCESLASLALPNTTIMLAQTVAAGAFNPPAPAGRGGRGGPNYKDLPAFCRVLASVRPTSDSDIKIEVWIPTDNWNGKFEGTANGAWAGSIGQAALAGALRRGYASGATDTGHEGNTASFALEHPEKMIDFQYRAVYEMTEKGKAITKAFYGDRFGEHGSGGEFQLRAAAVKRLTPPCRLEENRSQYRGRLNHVHTSAIVLFRRGSAGCLL